MSFVVLFFLFVSNILKKEREKKIRPSFDFGLSHKIYHSDVVIVISNKSYTGIFLFCMFLFLLWT